MRWDRAGVHTCELIEPAVEVNSALAAPHQLDDVNRLLKGLHRFAWRSNRSTHCLDGVPKATGAQAQLEAAATQQVERSCGFRQYRRRTERKVCDIRKDGDPLRAHRNRGQQRPRVVEPTLVGMILDADQVEAEIVGLHGELEGTVRGSQRLG